MLRKRFALGLVPLLILVIITGLVGIGVTRYLASTFQRELLNSLQTVTRTQAIRDLVQSMDDAFLSAQAGRLLEADKIFSKARDKIAGLLLEESAQVSPDPNVILAFKNLDENFQSLSKRGAQINQTVYSGSIATMLENEAIIHAFYSALDRYGKVQLEHAQFVSSQVKHLARTTTYLVLCVIGVAVIIWLFIALKLSQLFLLPLENLTRSVSTLGVGAWTSSVPESETDEIGLLGKAFNAMAVRLSQYEKALTERVLVAQRTMEAALNATPDPLFIVNNLGVETILNPAARDMLESNGLKYGLTEDLKSKVRQVLQTGVNYLPVGYEHGVTYKSKSGDRYYLPRILSVGDRMTGFLGAAVFLQDVTKFRLIDDAKTNLVGTVSHELKTPLTSLRMAIYLILENSGGKLSMRHHELLELARDESDRLLRILNDLLDLARLESGIAKLNLTTTVIKEFLNSITGEMKAILEAKKQKISIQVSDQVLTINVDPERMRHVFINLLSNASKYSANSTEIILYAQRTESGFVRCGVKDQGEGIAVNDIGNIFEKFYRVKGQTHEGAGLGLAIAREICVEHGGTINCTSELGIGSDFYVLIPG